MAKIPEIDTKYLGTITSDFVKVADTLKEASYQVRSRKFSDFPIFPISKAENPIGQLLIDRNQAGLDWYYNITYLDEFLQRLIIEEDKAEEFKKSYKDPDEFCCLFVMDGELTSFVYIPYPED